MISEFRVLKPFKISNGYHWFEGCLLLYLWEFCKALEWRNWQTHGTQNPASFTRYVGSTPTSSTNSSNYFPAAIAPPAIT